MENRIWIHENINLQKFDWADYREDFEQSRVASKEDLLELLALKRTGRIALKYIDLIGKKPVVVEEEVELEYLFNRHFDWVTTFEWGKMKYLEITSLDKRMTFSRAS